MLEYLTTDGKEVIFDCPICGQETIYQCDFIEGDPQVGCRDWYNCTQEQSCTCEVPTTEEVEEWLLDG